MNPYAVGIGLRQPHYRPLFEAPRALDFLEVHSENFFVDGGAALQVLERARRDYPLSLHGVGLSLGSGDGLAERHLDKLRSLVARVEPALVSEHLCWGAVDGVHYNDLLPFPYTDEALAVLAARIDQVQNALGRPILVENVSTYVAWSDSHWSETAFLAELARRTGCGILFDVNNLYVNAVNFGFNPLPLILELPPDAVGQIHLAGHLEADECLIDDHGSRVCADVWDLYRLAIAHLGPKPTLIEWDTDVPALAVLLDEAELARDVLKQSVHYQPASEVQHA